MLSDRPCCGEPGVAWAKGNIEGHHDAWGSQSHQAGTSATGIARGVAALVVAQVGEPPRLFDEGGLGELVLTKLSSWAGHGDCKGDMCFHNRPIREIQPQ